MSDGQATGHFIKVPREIATGCNADGMAVTADDFDFPLHFKSTNGRVWKMVLDPNDPTVSC